MDFSLERIRTLEPDLMQGLAFIGFNRGHELESIGG
jgi:hypothetical protein